MFRIHSGERLMVWSKTVFSFGDSLTSTQMNTIEDAVDEMAREYAAGDVPIAASLVAVATTGTTLTLSKSIQITRAGTLRIKFTLQESASGFAEAQINRNGSTIGTLRSDQSSTTTYSEDISGWSVDDTCEIFLRHTTGGGTATLTDFIIFSNVATVAVEIQEAP